MIKPTIGRVVWYWPDADVSQPWAALVCFVHSDERVNLTVFDESGYGKPKQDVYLYQGDSDRPNYNFAEWMPYQVGQAKAHTTAV